MTQLVKVVFQTPRLRVLKGRAAVILPMCVMPIPNLKNRKLDHLNIVTR
jgi:hypothetical protein